MTANRQTLHRRTLLTTGLTAALVAAPARAAMTDYEKALYDAAKKEGEITW